MSELTQQSAPLDEYPSGDDPRELKEYWQTELNSAKTRLKKWQKASDKIVNRFIGEADDHKADGARLNLFNSNVRTQLSMMYGHLPRIDVSRTDKTGNDDAARVAADMMQKLLRNDVSNNEQTYNAILPAVLQDRFLPGLGCARVRYTMQEVPSIDGGVQIHEDAPIDYYYWADILWGWGRNFAELPWIAFRSYMKKADVAKRFGTSIANALEYKQRQVTDLPDNTVSMNPDLDSAWQEAEIWEIWDKTNKKVCWYSSSYSKLLDSKADPLQLKDFYPCPAFFIANPTSTLYIPTPDYTLCQDLYAEIDLLQYRISILTTAVKAVGVYDKNASGVERMFTEGVDNDLIPVDNWAMFAEKGGLQGQIDWLPIADVVNALDKLRALRDETIGLLQQVSGMSDIMRGNLNNQYEGVGQSQIKAQFGSTRMQALQEEFSAFVADLMQLKAEVIAKHFEPSTIIKLSGAEFSFDANLIPQAMQVIKDPSGFALRVKIQPDTMAQMDYAQLKAERAEYLNGLSTFLQTAGPFMQQDPRSVPFLLMMLKWAMAGFKGASEIEGVLDQAIDAMSQRQNQKEMEKPDPEQIRAELQIKLEQMREAAKAKEIQMKAQADMQIREQDRQADINTKQAEAQLEAYRIQQEAQAEAQKLSAKMQADVMTEYLTSQFETEQARNTAMAQVESQLIKARAEIMKSMIEKQADMDMKAFEKQMDFDLEFAKLDEQRYEHETSLQASERQANRDEGSAKT